MNEKEFEAKNLNEAVAMACKYFSLSESELEIKIFTKGTTGIFGLMGVKNAKIAAAPKVNDVELLLNEVNLSNPDEKDSFALTAQEALKKILSYFELETNIVMSVQDDGIYLNIEGDGSGLLIGRRGQTLNAIQHIINKIVNKAASKNIFLVVDSENYRQRREENLKEIAKGLAKKAQQLKKPIASTPLNSHDRRIIHMALRDDHDLKTKSKGDGFYRRVLVLPQREPKN